MEEWQLDFQWLQVRHWVKDRFEKEKLPDLNAVLFVVGIQELGQIQEVYTKEEKQDLMHIATCRLLSEEGYYEFEGIDQDGWPHWKKNKIMEQISLVEEELLLKSLIIRYFKKLEVSL